MIRSKGLMQSETRGLAYVNHGRWLVDCRVCGSPTQFDPSKEKDFVCGACVPELFGVKFFPIPNDPEGGYSVAPDQRKRAAAREAGPKQKIVIPPDWQRLFEILRPRPTHFMNWLPGETIQDLMAENIQHGYPTQIKGGD